LRRSHRERSRLVREQTAHINRIKGLLFAQSIRGINVKSQYKTRTVARAAVIRTPSQLPTKTVADTLPAD
jgi:transposase